MSYERLELINGVTKWDTEKVQHLEDAIIKNENDIQKYHNENVENFVEYETITVGAGWDLLKNNIHNDDENIILPKPIDLDNLNLHIVSSDGKENFITNDSKGLIISRKDDGTYSLAYVSDVLNNAAVYEFRLKGNIDGTGDTIIPYVDMVNTEATLSIYQWSEGITKRVIPEEAIPDNIVRKDEIPTIDNIVTSVNGQTGDVVISKSWNDLQDKPFDEGYKLICAKTGDDFIPYVSEEVFKAGKNYIVIWNGVEYIGKTIDSNGREHYYEDYKASSLFLYDKNGNYVTGHIYCRYDDEYDAIVCTPCFIDDYNDTLYVYDPTKIEIKTIDDKFISENIARKVDLTWSSLGEHQTVLIPRGKNAYVTGCPAPTPGVKYTYTVYGEDDWSWSFTNTWWYDAGSYGYTWDQGEPESFFFFSDGSGVIGWFPELGAYITSQDYDHGNNEYEICQAEPTIQPVDEKFIPDTIARAPKATLDYVIETPTAEQYNALLDVLKQTGILI